MGLETPRATATVATVAFTPNRSFVFTSVEAPLKKVFEL